MIGKVTVTSTGYDPDGPPVCDPTLGLSPLALETDVILAICDWFPRVVTGIPGDYERDMARFEKACAATRRLKQLADLSTQVRPLGADELAMLIQQGSWDQKDYDLLREAINDACPL